MLPQLELMNSNLCTEIWVDSLRFHIYFPLSSYLAAAHTLYGLGLAKK